MALLDQSASLPKNILAQWMQVELVDATLRAVGNMLGVASALQISTAGVASTGFLRVAGVDVLTQTLARNSLLIGDSSNLAAAVNLAANTLLARASTGDAAAKAITDNALALLAENFAGMRAALDLEPGTDVQAYSATLADLAALTTTSYGRALLELADQAALRAAVGLVVGTDVQAYRAALTRVGGDGGDLASAGTVAIGAATGTAVRITGTTTITAFDSIAAGEERLVTFAGALTLTHHATALILPGGVSIVTAAGDVARFVSLGSGNWRCAGYLRASGERVNEFNARQGSNFSTTSTSLADVTGLVTPPLEPGALYNVQAHLPFVADATGGWKFRLRLPSGMGNQRVLATVYDTTAGTLAKAAKLGFGDSVAGATLEEGFATIAGTFQTPSGSPGTAAIQFAQNASGGTSTVNEASLRVWR